MIFTFTDFSVGQDVVKLIICNIYNTCISKTHIYTEYIKLIYAQYNKKVTVKLSFCVSDNKCCPQDVTGTIKQKFRLVPEGSLNSKGCLEQFRGKVERITVQDSSTSIILHRNFTCSVGRLVTCALYYY